MEKQQDSNPLKVRSYRNVLATAYRAYTGSFWKLVRATWIPAVVTATVSTALVIMVCKELYFFVPLACAMTLMEIVTWLCAAKWIATPLLQQLYHPVLSHRFILPTNILDIIVESRFRPWLTSIFMSVGIEILLLPVTFVVGLPLLVLIFAHFFSQSGAMTGDPTGMPSYILWLTGAVSIGTTLLLVYIHLFSAFVAYFAWGSAEARQREQQKLNIS